MLRRFYSSLANEVVSADSGSRALPKVTLLTSFYKPHSGNNLLSPLLP